jgi:hypothetical protein
VKSPFAVIAAGYVCGQVEYLKLKWKSKSYKGSFNGDFATDARNKTTGVGGMAPLHLLEQRRRRQRRRRFQQWHDLALPNRFKRICARAQRARCAWRRQWQCVSAVETAAGRTLIPAFAAAASWPCLALSFL